MPVTPALHEAVTAAAAAAGVSISEWMRRAARVLMAAHQEAGHGRDELEDCGCGGCAKSRELAREQAEGWGRGGCVAKRVHP